MSVVGDLQKANIGWAHQWEHPLQGEAATLTLQRLDASNAPTDSKTVSSFRFSTQTLDGYSLPPGALFELQIPEDALADSDLDRVARIKHGNRGYEILRGSPVPPNGQVRVWRLWVALVEDA